MGRCPVQFCVPTSLFSMGTLTLGGRCGWRRLRGGTQFAAPPLAYDADATRGVARDRSARHPSLSTVVSRENILGYKPNEPFMTVVCPICNSSAQELPRTGDATAFQCPMHGDFKVADTVFAEAKAKDYTRDQWEAALDKAEERAEPEGWPLVITDDFF